MSNRIIIALITYVLISNYAFTNQKKDIKAYHKNSYLTFETEDGSTKYWIDGRIMLDYGKIHNSSNNLPSGAEARRARFAIKSIIDKKWSGEFDLSLTPNNDHGTAEDIKVMDLWVSYIGLDQINIKIGNHKPPFSIDEVTTSRWLTFMERALPNAFTVSRRLGISATNWNENYWVSAGTFSDELGKGSEDSQYESSGIAARALYRLPVTNDKIFHIGASYMSFAPEANGTYPNTIEVKTRGETHFNKIKLLDTSTITYCKNHSATSVEFLGKIGSLSMQSEIMTYQIERKDSYQNVAFSGSYFWVSYIITGEEKEYYMDQAEFGTIIPKSKNGALEIAFRTSTIDLNDKDASIMAGAATNTTLGINWYANQNIRFMLNYIMVDNDANATGDGSPVYTGNDDYDITALRLQYLF